MIDFLFSPFVDYAFMRHALAATLILSLGSTPLGVFMSLRRMTLVGDAMSHAILPGVALAFAVFGFAILPMSIGGLLAGVIVAMLAAMLSRMTKLKEDASFTMFYLVSLAAGVTIISVNGSNVDLMHMLFGNILAIDYDTLLLVSVVTCVSLFALAGFYRGFVIECFDPDFAAATTYGKGLLRVNPNILFFALLVLNLVAAFQALGTLMALGLMILPAIAARFWTRNLDFVIPVSVGIAMIASFSGLLLSYYHKIPSGPAVILIAGIIAIASSIVGRIDSVRCYFAK